MLLAVSLTEPLQITSAGIWKIKFQQGRVTLDMVCRLQHSIQSAALLHSVSCTATAAPVALLQPAGLELCQNMSKRQIPPLSAHGRGRTVYQCKRDSIRSA